MKLIFILLSALIGFINADLVPILIYYKSNEVKQNSIIAGQKVTSDEVLKHVPTNVDLIVVNGGLNNEDLNKLELSNIEKPVYFHPLVESTANLIESITKNKKFKISSQILVNSADDAINEFLSKKKNFKSDAIILTGIRQRTVYAEIHSRSRRAIASSNSSNMEEVYGSRCAAIFDSVYIIDHSSTDQKPIDLMVTDSVFTCENETSTLSMDVTMNTTVLGGNIQKINLVFISSNGSSYWKLNDSSNVVTTVGDLGIQYMGTPYGMETPNMFSFVCTRTYFQLYNSSAANLPLVKVALYIEKLQIQPSLMVVNETNYEFGRVNYCQGFFSNGIWMAITSSLLLTAILAFGISFLFNIKTMDRFDDPKGKQLNIAAEK